MPIGSNGHSRKRKWQTWVIPFSQFVVFCSFLFARKRAQYSKSPEIVQAEVQENLNLGRVVHLTNMGRADLAGTLGEGIFET